MTTRKPRGKCPVCDTSVALKSDGTIGYHVRSQNIDRLPWLTERCPGQFQRPTEPIYPAYDHNWLQAKNVSTSSKFHYVVLDVDSEEVQLLAYCALKDGARWELDTGRAQDLNYTRHRKCVACVKHLAEEESKVSYGEEELTTPYSQTAVTKTPRTKRDQLTAKMERHQQEAARLAAKVAELEALPDEPEVEDGEPNVIWFTKTFQNGTRDYTYAAAKGGDGLWYTTGPASPKGYTWDQLVEWMYDGDECNAWHAVSYNPL